MSTFIFPATNVTISGGATEAKQDAEILLLTDIESNTDGLETLATAGNASLSSIDGKILTDAQLRASPVSVSGPITDAQLRASAVPVDVTGSVLPTGAATEATLSSIASEDFATEATLASIDGNVVRADTDDVTITSSALPTGASTETKQDTGNSSLASIDGKVLTDTQLRATPVPVSGPLTDAQLRAVAVPVSGTVTATGPLTDTQLRATPVPVSGTVTATGPLTDTQLRASAVPVSLTSTTITGTAAVTQSGTWTVQPGNTPNTTAWLVKEQKSSTSALSNVSSSATSVTLLASNANRLNATIFNDSTQVLYVKFGATASTTSYTVQIAANGYYELPNGNTYTGIIDGIWASANGNARITELT